MIDLDIKDKCFVCLCPELQTEKLVYRTCAGKTDVHIHIFCQNEEKCKEMQEARNEQTGTMSFLRWY